MEIARAKLKKVRISPQKGRWAADLIRNLLVDEALFQLKMSPLKGAVPLYKTLRSAIANAENNAMESRDDLKVVEVRVDAGPTYKRSTPRNKGGKHPIMKRTSHFEVVVGR